LVGKLRHHLTPVKQAGLPRDLAPALLQAFSGFARCLDAHPMISGGRQS
jgi:hypothetical protein